MSVILNWENPETTYLPVTRSMRVLRGGSHTLLSNDAPWGFFEDVGGLDLGELYEIQLLDGQGNMIGQIESADIDRYRRPSDTCKLLFAFTEPTGAPSHGRKLRFANPANQSFSQTICCNFQGKAEALFRFGQRILIYVEGMDHALDCVVPLKQEACWEDLVVRGSWVLAELRGVNP